MQHSNQKFLTKSVKIQMIITFISLLLLASSKNLSLSAAAEGDTFHREQFRLEQASTRFYVTTVDFNTTIYINCTSVYEGVFYLYLFNFRPTETILHENNSINENLVAGAVAYNSTPVDVFSAGLNATVKSLTISYNATKTAMYYLEIVLLENGPDTFVMESTREFQPYFIPFIPGYPLEMFIGGSTLGIILVLRKTKRSKIVS